MFKSNCFEGLEIEGKTIGDMNINPGVFLIRAILNRYEFRGNGDVFYLDDNGGKIFAGYCYGTKGKIVASESEYNSIRYRYYKELRLFEEEAAKWLRKEHLISRGNEVRLIDCSGFVVEALIENSNYLGFHNSNNRSAMGHINATSAVMFSRDIYTNRVLDHNRVEVGDLIVRIEGETNHVGIIYRREGEIVSILEARNTEYGISMDRDLSIKDYEFGKCNLKNMDGSDSFFKVYRLKHFVPADKD